MKTIGENELELPREKLIRIGASNLKNHELLAILLSTGIKGLPVLEFAKEILASIDLKRFKTLELIELKNIKGINNAKACTILASIELSRRILEINDNELPIVDSAETALNFSQNLVNSRKEMLQVLYLNARNQLIHTEIISIGSLDAITAYPRDIFEPAIRYMARFLILMHNHPSGNTTPSTEDIDFTKNIVTAGKLLGIEILDHLVVSKSGYSSVFSILE
jgi:DNA repair protein RadC